MFSAKRFLAIFPLLIFSALMYSCSSGGGGGEAPTTPTVQSVSAQIGGNVTTGNISSQSLPSDLKVLVKAVSINSKGDKIDSKVTEAQDGYFSVSLLLDNNGGKIILTASAEGFNDGTKTIEYTKPSDVETLNISIEIDPVKQTIVPVPSINIQSANSGKFIRVGFFKNKKGVTKTAVGDQIKTLAANGDQLILEMGIPVSKLQSNTSALKISYKDYQPSNPDDYDNFPGEQTSDGQELISFGFDWLDIRDANTGENPFISSGSVSSQIARTDLGEYYRLLRYVDCEQLTKIKNALGTLDEDPDKPGIQFTFWAYDWDQGAWVTAGQGTFVNSNSINYYVDGENEDTVDTAWDYIIQNGCVDTQGATVDCTNPDDPNYATACIDVNGDGTPENISCVDNNVIVDENNVCAQNTSTYVVVSVTNPALEWKNLDYIKPSTEGIPEVSCTITIQDDQGNPISTWVESNPINDCMDWSEDSTSYETGQVTLTSVNYCANDTTKSPQANISYYDPINYMYTDYASNPVTFGEGCDITITITDINKCTVEGYIKDEETNLPKGDAYVWVHDNNWNVYRWGYTDDNGKYSIKVPCGMDLKLESYYNYDNPYTFNVNGTVNGNETTDANNVAVLDDIIATNYPPYGYAWLSNYYVSQGSSITAYLYAWDYEGDTPISYKMKVIDPNNNVIYSTTGTINNNYDQIEETIDTAGLSGTYSVEFIIADSGYQGDISTLSQQTTTVYAGDFEVYTGNSAPVISYFYAYPSTVSSAGQDVTLYGWAYDIDSTSLISTIDYACYDNADTTINSASGTVDATDLLNNGYQTFTIPDNSSIYYCDITWNVSDDTSTTTDTARIYVVNNPPEVYIWTDSQVVPETETSATIYSYIYEPEGEGFTCEWIVDGNVVSSGDSSNSGCDSYTLDLSGYTAPATINVQLCVTDNSGNKSCTSLNVLYGTLSDVQINIQ